MILEHKTIREVAGPLMLVDGISGVKYGELGTITLEDGSRRRCKVLELDGDKALLQEPLFAQLGKKYGKSAPQIILRWHIQSGNIVIPGSKNPDHIKSNFDLFDFVLTNEEMAQITALNKNVRYYTSTPEMLKKYAEMVPPVDEQK